MVEAQIGSISQQKNTDNGRYVCESLNQLAKEIKQQFKRSNRKVKKLIVLCTYNNLIEHKTFL